ncbi:hypothetical protein K439DRAFT_1624308 [Ramaria rubella]|nr:hypothetical protein K439DRAFT_1624308 [Ramaria rubella]
MDGRRPRSAHAQTARTKNEVVPSGVWQLGARAGTEDWVVGWFDNDLEGDSAVAAILPYLVSQLHDTADKGTTVLQFEQPRVREVIRSNYRISFQDTYLLPLGLGKSYTAHWRKVTMIDKPSIIETLAVGVRRTGRTLGSYKGGRRMFVASRSNMIKESDPAVFRLSRSNERIQRKIRNARLGKRSNAATNVIGRPDTAR